MLNIKIPDSYILSNMNGSFYLWTNKPYSKYCGLFFRIDGKVIKCVESIDTGIRLENTTDNIIGITNKRKGLFESMYLCYNSNAFAYNLSAVSDVVINLDVREANDLDEWGRKYDVSVEKGVIVIHYRKEDGKGREQYSYYIAIRSNFLTYKEIGKFVEVDYSYDRFRNSSDKRYVYGAIKLGCSFFTLSMSKYRNDAIKQAEYLFRKYPGIMKQDKSIKIKPELVFAENDVTEAYKSACISLEKLINYEGIYAGLPWFFQYWTRDELISIGYMINRNNLSDVHNIFSKYFVLPVYCGRLPAMRPDIGNKSIDALGWLFMRFKEFHDLLKDKRELNKYYPKKKLDEAIKYFEKNIYFIEKYHIREGLLRSEKDETWMDTSASGDIRDGFCIEIQALLLRSYRVLYELTGNKIHKENEEKLKLLVVKKFLKKNILADRVSLEGKQILTIRPNIFIAYYVYPWLFNKNEWEKVFDKALDALWLDWGGLASIDKSSTMFIDTYSGENNLSYHRGDSWFYLNSMAAICMHDLNKAKYSDKIEKIISACSEDCLNKGVIGSISEVSSAKELAGYGCLSQAWSLAMFIELVEKVKGNQ